MSDYKKFTKELSEDINKLSESQAKLYFAIYMRDAIITKRITENIQIIKRNIETDLNNCFYNFEKYLKLKEKDES